MPVEVRLPQLADAMTVARLGAWLKREGDSVSTGEPILEVETDKTNVEIEAPAAGVLGEILVPAGSEGVAVGVLLATILEVHPAAASPRHTEAEWPNTAKPAATGPVELRAAPSPSVTPSGPERTSTDTDGPANVTPLARQIAALAGLDLSMVRPGDDSRITKAIVEAMLDTRRSSSPPDVSRVVESSSDRHTPSGAQFKDLPLSAIRRVTAQRLQQAKQTVPHFYLESECRVDILMDLRRRWNARASGPKVTVTDLLVFAVSRALGKVPLANSSWIESGVRVFENVDIAIAVNTPAGLITPIIRGCERKSITAISRELARLAERARRGSLKPDEYMGGTFTISNLGMFAVTRILPIVNPPQACILGVGAIEQQPVVERDQVVAGHVLHCTLAADHRAIDGAAGAEFMTELRRLLEDPMSMALEA
jgi:pyruvate dehydrogenase E2 component (dihydrolipoamide acetyltransferase)